MINIILSKEIKYQSSIAEEEKNYAKELLEEILKNAIEQESSDIHIEPNKDDFLIRFRVDGELRDIVRLDMNKYNQLVTVIKLRGNMNISEKRIPQDGRMEIESNNKNIDIRISSSPVIDGEKIVLRILSNKEFLNDQQDLGFRKEDIDKIDKIINMSSGILLVTGSTGSGKTTTIYSILKKLLDDRRNIMTIEDPVEYKIEGINQIQVNNKIGLDFDLGLKSILRQDPDIIMVGEIRDVETAKTAIRAASTGHLVISTMHTKDAVSSITRLKEMGIEEYLISSSVIGVISQRLVKKICYECSHDITIENIDSNKTKHKVICGCEECNFTGYKNRTVVYEVLEVTKEIRNMINNNNTHEEIKDMAIKQGMITLKDNALKLISENITTTEECGFINAI